uniref:Uncharacterized protein n=1 Tax=Panagrolaimus sp. JU765 TaxID=591449 RepID=A0AC34Q7R5_9BILA
MSGKGGRKNLGTVVECSETGDECNLPLLTTTNDSASTENENKEPIQEASISNEKHDSEQSKTVVVDSLILDEHVNQQLNRSREDLPRRDSSQKKSRSSVFAQSRLNFINFINNVSAPVRSTKK